MALAKRENSCWVGHTQTVTAATAADNDESMMTMTTDQ